MKMKRVGRIGGVLHKHFKRCLFRRLCQNLVLVHSEIFADASSTVKSNISLN